jgi:hypothetical protein
MNLVPLEAQLLILAVLFYIYDSSVLLFSNEGVITPSWKNWSAQTNLKGLVLLRKRLFIPNLLLPTALFSGCTGSRKACRKPPRWSGRKKITVWMVWPASLRHGTGPVRHHPHHLLFLSQRSRIAGLPGPDLPDPHWGRHAAAPTPEAPWRQHEKCLVAVPGCLLCPPFTINIVRKLSLARRLQANFVDSAFQLVDAAQWERVQAELIACMDAEIDAADSKDSSARWVASKNRLQGMQKPHQTGPVRLHQAACSGAWRASLACPRQSLPMR